MGLNSTFLLILNNKNDGKNIAITDNIIPAKLRTCTNAFGTIIAMNTIAGIILPYKPCIFYEVSIIIAEFSKRM